jgi:hypothetical protein
MLMLPRDQVEAIVLQAADYPQHDEPAMAEHRAAAARKWEQEARDFLKFAAIDQAAFGARIGAAVTRDVTALEAARDELAAKEDKAAGALAAERAAQDRAREHAEHARQVHVEWKRVQGRGAPREQTDALIASQAAAAVAQGEQAAAEGAAAARVLADRELEAARSRVAELEDKLRSGREWAANPGRAPYSPQTCMQNVPHLLRVWESLTPLEQQFVRNAVTTFAVVSGLFDQIKEQGAAEREAELVGKRPQHGAFALPVAVPGTAGR